MKFVSDGQITYNIHLVTEELFREKGGTNILTVIRRPGKPDVLKRTPNDNQEYSLDCQVYEHTITGFLEADGQVRLRSVEEQATENKKFQKSQIPVVPVLRHSKKALFLPIIPEPNYAKRLSKRMKTPDLQGFITTNMESLQRAHRAGLIHGDPFPSNIMTPKGYTGLFLDHDVALSGPFDKEADLAKHLYGLALCVPNTPQLLNVLERYRETHALGQYQYEYLQQFIRRYGILYRRWGTKNETLAQRMETRLDRIAAIMK